MSDIEILGEIRSEYNVFDERERPYYEALSKAIRILKEHESEMDNPCSDCQEFDCYGCEHKK